MPYNEWLADRVRAALAAEPDVVEKRMFGGLAFMVNGRLCLFVGGGRGSEDDLMVRLGIEGAEAALSHTGASHTTINGKPFTGYITVDESGQRDLHGWVSLALDFNRQLVASGTK